MTKPVIIADSSPLISLAIIGQLELLPRLYQRVIIPPAVGMKLSFKVRACRVLKPSADAHGLKLKRLRRMF
jgi:predicted nucleic acid-binding protein